MKKKYCKSISNYRQYVNTWWWGKTITLVSTDGYSTVELQFDNSLPNMAVIKGLMVFTTRQHEGYGTEMMNLCEHIAKKEDAKFIQLSVNKEHVLLVNWYERLGFTIIQEDEHEYVMLKALDNYQKQWKPADGDDLPDIGREVVVFTQNFPNDAGIMSVSIAHRPNSNGCDGKSLSTGKVEHYTPKTYGKGGWNQPNVKWWLDVDKSPNVEDKI